MDAGAQAALRGYRLQALYTLYRLLKAAPGLVFRLEGHEDLDVYDAEGRLQEVIQVKAYGVPLTLAPLQGFFQRAADRWESPEGREVVVSFGDYGEQLRRLAANDREAQVAVAAQLQAWAIAPGAAQHLAQHVQLLQVDEAELERAVWDRLSQDLTGTDPEAAFDLLHTWLFQLAERHGAVRAGDLRDRLQAIGRFLAERSAHHAEWFTTIVPLMAARRPPDEAGLRGEFYLGVSARYAHILSGADVPRPAPLEQIDQAFHTHRLVVVRGASGQGKSALAYRYLHDYVPQGWRFEIRLLQDRRHALSVARALLGHLDAVDVPAYIYLDVPPGDATWIDLVRELHQHPSARILVTIREEDWRRASSQRGLLEIAEIEVQFGETEAQEIYARLSERAATPALLDFQDAWRQFGEGGPLLEFTYLITQHGTLASRLRAQLDHLRDEVNCGARLADELELLRRVAVASAYGAQLDAKATVAALTLPEPQRSIELLEKEYLLRQDEAGRTLSGLHPIRSAALAALLTDELFHPWPEVALRLLGQLRENDLGTFLMHAFARQPHHRDLLLDAALKRPVITYTGAATTLEALLWMGVQTFLDHNGAVIEEARAVFGQGWWAVLMADVGQVGEVTQGDGRPWFEVLDILPADQQARMAEFHGRLTERGAALQLARTWLSQLPAPLALPHGAGAWAKLAPLLYWLARLAPQPRHTRTILAGLGEMQNQLSLDTAADLIFAASFDPDEQVQAAIGALQVTLIPRFQREAQVAVLEDDGTQVTAHFVFDLDSLSHPEEHPGASENVIHRETMWRVETLRRLIPGRATYGSQGYGHLIREFPWPHDESRKAVGAPHLPPRWATQLNAQFSNLGTYPRRPDTWAAYAADLLACRRMVVSNLEQWIRAGRAFFRTQGGTLCGAGGFLDLDQWAQTQRQIARLPSLPKVAVDEWGEGSEGMAVRHRRSGHSADDPASQSLGLRRYHAYLQATREYFRDLEFFHRQALPILGFLPALSRLPETPQLLEVKRQQLREHRLTERDLDPHLATFNFADAVSHLAPFQGEFRALFAPFVEAGQLARLERQETEVLQTAWALWHFFTRHAARRGVPDAVNEAQGGWQRVLTAVRRELKRSLSALATQGIDASLLPHQPIWNGQPALWIGFDIADPADLAQAYEQVFLALRQVLPMAAATSLRSYALTLTWPTIHLVPTLKGGALQPVSWRYDMRTLLLSRDEDLGAWSHTPRPLSEPEWQVLGLRRWQPPGQEGLQEAAQALALLVWQTGHALGVQTLPPLSALGQELIDAYVLRQRQTVHDAAEVFLHRTAQVLGQVRARTGAELTAQLAAGQGFHRLSDLAGAYEPLSALHKQFAPVLLDWASDLLSRPAE